MVYERWDGAKRNLMFYDPTPEPLEADIDYRDVFLDWCASTAVRVLFPHGLPWPLSRSHGSVTRPLQDRYI